MNWLHFSDFHIGGTPGAQKDALSSLLVYIKKMIEAPVDAVLLTGDIAYSGLAPEYNNFESIFLNPLRSLSVIKDAQIFCVPGNHDVNCEEASPITWEGIRSRNQAIFFDEDDTGTRARKDRSRAFEAYLDFIHRNELHSPDPTREVSKLFESVSSLPIDILGTNTAFFCDKEEESDKPTQPWPAASIRARAIQHRPNRPLLIIGHHSIRCFLPLHQKHFSTFLHDNQCVYIHGHEHTMDYSANANGSIRTIGFGASYLDRLDSNSGSQYRNSFAHCKIHASQLMINCHSWDSNVGRWDDSTRSSFPSAVPTLAQAGSTAQFTLPRAIGKDREQKQSTLLTSAKRKHPTPDSIALASPPSQQTWMKLLALSERIGPPNTASPRRVETNKVVDGKVELVLESNNKRDLVICIQGESHILSAKEVESYNTRLDTEDLNSVVVVSLGKTSSEARDMYLRLRNRKPIEVLDNKAIIADWRKLASVPQAEMMSCHDAAITRINILIHSDEVYILIVQTNTTQSSFSIVDPNGISISPTHSVVAAVRASNSALARLPYSGATSDQATTDPDANFDERTYLERCYTENNVMRYAALANIGIRFSELSLLDVYIDASACEADKNNVSRIEALLEDHLAPYPTTERLKHQIKQQFINSSRQDERRETSQAREFYQKYGAVLLTGDPGSGKTCFVKSEILAYASRIRGSNNASEWHSIHIPILVPLSQAAAEPDLQQVGVLEIASRLLERRGISFPSDLMISLQNEGRLALFFDGLDEVVSIEKRATIVQQINNIVTTGLKSGNRIVVTSRPAAVSVINLLPELHKLELQGLTESEVQSLATRILALKLSETADGVVIDLPAASPDSRVVAQLIRDCRSKPGVARLAQNPLLLTLLVMIYANSGAPSAKRHRIYEEAIKTLTSVRGRQSGHEPVSLQDLRERLGAVALSVYRKESGLLPTRSEVSDVIRGAMRRQSGRDATKADADRYVQRVAESTGLIAIGGEGGRSDYDSIVTFMHHSFLEYFAAVGLNRELAEVDFQGLLTQPRWREILTLLAGIIGESADIAPVLKRCIGADGTNFGNIDARLLQFALDCALESEVPSEAAVRLLCDSISQCVRTGPAKHDSWVRSQLGQRLAQLLATCGPSGIEETLSGLVRDKDHEVSAAGISLAGESCGESPELPTLRKTIEECSANSDELTQRAVCEAGEKIAWLRTPAIRQAIGRSLNRSAPVRCAALRAISSIPGLAADHWSFLITALDDNSEPVRQLACRAALRGGLDGDVATFDLSRKRVVANALQRLHERPIESDFTLGRLKKQTVDRLLNSPLRDDRLIGIHFVPLVAESSGYAHETLLGILSGSDDHEEVAAALRAIYSSRETQLLISTAELRMVTSFLETGRSNVRRASILLLHRFTADVNAMRPLFDRGLRDLENSEFSLSTSALSRSHVMQDEIALLFARELFTRLAPGFKSSDTHAKEVQSLLDASERLGHTLNSETVSRVRDVIKDFRIAERIRSSAVRAYPAIAAPEPQVVRFITELITNPPLALVNDVVYTIAILARQCRKSVDYIVSCVESMAELREAAMLFHQQLTNQTVTNSTEESISALRSGINEVTQLITTFEEFVRDRK